MPNVWYVAKASRTIEPAGVNVHFNDPKSAVESGLVLSGDTIVIFGDVDPTTKLPLPFITTYVTTTGKSLNIDMRGAIWEITTGSPTGFIGRIWSNNTVTWNIYGSGTIRTTSNYADQNDQIFRSETGFFVNLDEGIMLHVAANSINYMFGPKTTVNAFRTSLLYSGPYELMQGGPAGTCTVTAENCAIVKVDGNVTKQLCSPSASNIANIYDSILDGRWTGSFSNGTITFLNNVYFDCTAPDGDTQSTPADPQFEDKQYGKFMPTNATVLSKTGFERRISAGGRSGIGAAGYIGSSASHVHNDKKAKIVNGDALYTGWVESDANISWNVTLRQWESGVGLVVSTLIDNSNSNKGQDLSNGFGVKYVIPGILSTLSSTPNSSKIIDYSQASTLYGLEFAEHASTPDPTGNEIQHHKQLAGYSGRYARARLTFRADGV